MTLRLGFRDGVAGSEAIAQSIVVTAAEKAKRIFEDLALSWASLVGSEGSAGGQTYSAAEALA
jgi:hypothetical protein